MLSIEFAAAITVSATGPQLGQLVLPKASYKCKTRQQQTFHQGESITAVIVLNMHGANDGVGDGDDVNQTDAAVHTESTQPHNHRH
jgi:hypothetical protein